MPLGWILGGASLLSGIIGSGAASSAATTQANSANAATGLQQHIFDTTTGNLAPFIGAGNNALGPLLKMLGIGGSISDIDPSKLSGAQLGDVNSYLTGYVRDALGKKYSGMDDIGTGQVGGSLVNGKNVYDPNNINVDVRQPGWDFKTLQDQYPGFDASKVLNLAGMGPGNSPLLKAPDKFSAPGAFTSTPFTNPNTPLNIGAYTPGQVAQPTTFSGGGPFSFGSFSFDPSQLANDPGYKFQLSQGLDAITNRAAASGGIMGGNTLKSIADYSQGLAGTTLNDAFNRALQGYQTNYSTALGVDTTNFNQSLSTDQLNFQKQLQSFEANEGARLAGTKLNTDTTLAQGAQNFGQALQTNQTNFTQGLAGQTTNYDQQLQSFLTNLGIDTNQKDSIFNMLYSLMGLGENAAAGQGQIGASTGANMAGTITGAGNALAAGQVGSANAISGGLNNFGQMFLLSKLFGGGGGSGGGANLYGIG